MSYLEHVKETLNSTPGYDTNAYEQYLKINYDYYTGRLLLYAVYLFIIYAFLVLSLVELSKSEEINMGYLVEAKSALPSVV